jgi:phosphohistidine phosphatase
MIDPIHTLMLMRHASTEDSRPGHRDTDRRLTAEGRDQAAALGDQLRSEHVQIDLVLCSSALRARQTVEALRSAAPVVVSDRLYNAGGDEILEAVRELDDGQLHVLVVGHGPGLPGLVYELADPDSSDPTALALIDGRFPAGTLATLAVDGPWSELEQATLVSVRLPHRP